LSCRPTGSRLVTCLLPLTLTHAYIATGLLSARASSPSCSRGTLAPPRHWGTLSAILPAVRVAPNRRGFFLDPSGRGRPSQRRDARSDAAHQRQTDRQVSRGDGLVTVISRDLRYPLDWPDPLRRRASTWRSPSTSAQSQILRTTRTLGKCRAFRPTRAPRRSPCRALRPTCDSCGEPVLISVSQAEAGGSVAAPPPAHGSQQTCRGHRSTRVWDQ
jgi:hypothetical protein